MRPIKSLILAVAILMVGAIVAGCSSGFVSAGNTDTNPTQLPLSNSVIKPTNGLVQSSSGGAVTIDVKWLADRRDALVFDVSMNTHSVDLDGYDLSKLAVLRDDTGQEYQASSWNSAAGGHHRQGTLTFQIPPSMKQGQVKYFEIAIRDVAGVKERVLRWQLS